MKSPKHIVQLAGGIRFRPDEKADERILAAAEAALSKKTFPDTKPEKVRITIMRNPMIRIAVAAVVVIACLIGLSLWRSTGSGIALADVLARIEKVSAYMYRINSTVTGQMVGDKPINRETHATMLASQEYGMKMSMETLDPNSGRSSLQEWYMLRQNKAVIILVPDEKKYVRMDYNETLIERQQKQNNDPRAMVEQILKCNYTSLGKSTIDGVEVEGFQTTDPNFLGGVLGEVDVKMWVDVKTQLPVQSDMDLQMSNQMHIHIVTYDFQWDVPVDAAEFEPVIPDDYTTLPGGPIKMPAINEESTVLGLRLCAELSGRYPEKLDLPSVMSVMTQIKDPNSLDLAMMQAKDPNSLALTRLREQYKGLTQEERTRQVIETMKPIFGLGSFYTLLVNDKKDPAYYGKVVTPQDADKVLLRWKISDNEYRVIFGDLHTETVTTDALAELEKVLPE